MTDLTGIFSDARDSSATTNPSGRSGSSDTKNPSKKKTSPRKKRSEKRRAYLESLKKEAGYTRTLNGAKTHGTSGDACLDLFAVAGGMRHRSDRDLINLFDGAYLENPELAMKLLFYIRDIRGGLGEREVFRTLIRHVAKAWPESAKKNVALIPEYGRYDDLMCLMRTSSQKKVLEVIREQLKEDLAALDLRNAGDTGAHISLLAKWLPSINASSSRTRGQAKVLCNALNMGEGEYRKLLAKLRAAICLTECCLTALKNEKINYEAVPAGAMLKYRGAFLRHDRDRFLKYIEDVLVQDKNIHSGTLFPYDILRPYLRDFSRHVCYSDVPGEELLEVLWDHQDGAVAGNNAISVIDTSGSMYWHREGTPMPALISQSLGLFYAERCKGLFHNMFITFESQPHLVEIRGATIREKLCSIQRASWGGSTNLEAVFDLILRSAVHAHLPQEQMPSTIYIISDMEFNYAVRNPDKTVYDNAKEAFEACGYRMPAVVFHNVNSWQMQVPVRAHEKGTALTSGAGTNSFKYRFDGNITPMEHMLRVLNSSRYAAVHA